MPRETKEQKEAREEAQRQAREEALKEFRQILPKRLFEMQAIAQTIGISVHTKMIESGPEVTFSCVVESSRYLDETVEETLNYESQPWEVDAVESWIHTKKREYDAKMRRSQIAKDLIAKLSDEEKTALKENIHLMR